MEIRKKKKIKNHYLQKQVTLGAYMSIIMYWELLQQQSLWQDTTW